MREILQNNTGELDARTIWPRRCATLATQWQQPSSPYAYTPFAAGLVARQLRFGARLGEVTPGDARDILRVRGVSSRYLTWLPMLKQAVRNFIFRGFLSKKAPENLVSRGCYNPRTILDIVIVKAPLRLICLSSPADPFARAAGVCRSNIIATCYHWRDYQRCMRTAAAVCSTDANQIPRNNDKYNRVGRRVASGWFIVLRYYLFIRDFNNSLAAAPGARIHTAHIAPITRERRASCGGYVRHIPNVNDELIHACVASDYVAGRSFFFSLLDVRKRRALACAILFEKSRVPDHRSYVRLADSLTRGFPISIDNRAPPESRFQTHRSLDRPTLDSLS